MRRVIMKKIVFIGGLVAWAVSAFAMETKQQREFSTSENPSGLKFKIELTETGSIKFIKDAPGSFLLDQRRSSAQNIIAIYGAKQYNIQQKLNAIEEDLREDLS